MTRTANIVSRQPVWAFVFAATFLMGGLGQLAQGGNYLLDPNYAGVDGAPLGTYAGAYKTVTAALGATGMPSGASATNPNRLFIAAGTYNTAITTGVSLSNSRNNIALVGMTGNPDDVVITSFLDSLYNPGSGALGTTGSSTLQLKGNNTSALGITFANSTNTPYIVNVGHKAVTPTGDYVNGTTAQTNNQPAVALLLQGDQQAFQNCKFLGYQDTLYTKGGRSYFKNSTVSGDIDFIFANGTTVFDNSTINLDGDHSGGTITAASTDKRQSNGLVFLNSTITANSVKNNPVIDPQGAANASGPAANSMYLGRPWGWQQVGGDASSVFINTKMPSAIRGVGWLAWNGNETTVGNGKQGGDPTKDARYAEYNSTDLITNLPVDVSTRVAWSHQLTASQAAAYTVANLFSFESGYGWYGQGYPVGDLNNPGTGSANPGDANYSWPAYWGDRNSNNDTNNATVSQTYPTPGNPAGYTNPNWTLQSSWEPMSQLSIAAVPEPSTIFLMTCGAFVLAFAKRRKVRLVKLACVALIVAGALAGSPAHAASMWNVDLVGANAMSGAAVVGSAGDFWNTAEVAQAGQNLAVKDGTGGSLHNITMNFVATGALFGFNADGTANPAALMDGFGTSVNNGSGTAASPLSFGFSGLAPSSAYTVYAYGASLTGTDRGTNFFQTIGGAVLGATTGTSTDINAGVGKAYTTFAISTDALGEFTIRTNFNSGTSAQAPVNGFQIIGATPVPEPASIGMLVMGAILVFAWKKR